MSAHKVIHAGIWSILSAGIAALGGNSAAQEIGSSALDQATNETKAQAAQYNRYPLRLGSAGFTVSAGLMGEYVDNVYLTEHNLKDDFIIAPQLGAGFFLPIGQLNSLSANVDLTFYHYLKNTELNNPWPTVNPNSQLAFNIYSGDVVVRLTEEFSYLELPYHEYGGVFYNVYNTGRFARYHNLVGGVATWKLQDISVEAGYHHENLISDGSTYDYINRCSELFDAKAMVVVAGPVSTGLEANGSWNAFEHRELQDHWRAGIGPAVQVRFSDYIKARFGAGYQRLQYDSPQASAYDLSGVNLGYGYAQVNHVINRYLNHSLEVSHDNNLGINAPNLEGTHISYSLAWNVNEQFQITPYFSYHWYKESFCSDRQDLYHEKFDYLSGGIAGEYRLTQHWRANMRYDYRLKDSEFADFGYAQNRVTLRTMYQF
jgi:hypothetical protein